MNIGLLIVTTIGGIAGLASTLYLIISLPAVIVWKLYRKATVFPYQASCYLTNFLPCKISKKLFDYLTNKRRPALRAGVL